MEAMRATWTDERMDDLNGRVDELARRMDQQFDRVDRQFERVDERLDRMADRIDSLQRSMLQLGGGMIATFAIGFAGLILTGI
jgi:predicted transcriptional regulator